MISEVSAEVLRQIWWDSITGQLGGEIQSFLRLKHMTLGKRLQECCLSGRNRAILLRIEMTESTV
jgi:hypothetical protein